MSAEEEEKDLEEMKKELAFYRNQTKVLRTRNRDLRNALLVAEKGEGTDTTVEGEQETTSNNSISDIRKIIANSKKQISEKLTQFKESIDEPNDNEGSTAVVAPTTDSTASPPPSNAGAPTTPKFTATMGDSTGTAAKPAVSTGEVETLQYQIDYLKKEVDRLENFLEQSEMVNNRLRQLLTEHNIDVSEISNAIAEVSKTAISGTKKKDTEKMVANKIPEPVKKEPVKQVKEKPEPKATDKKLDPEVDNLFKEFKSKINSGINDEQIKMEILELREELMSYIPHSRVFYEMQIEYRKWKKGTSSVKDLKKAIKEWEKTIISTM